MKTIILVSGYISSGKDTTSDYLVEKYSLLGYRAKKIALADKLKHITQKLIKVFYNVDISIDEFYDQESKERQRVDMPTLRTLLQRVGSDIFRDMLWKDIWCDIVAKDISSIDVAIISDWRFHNELEYFSNLYINGDIVKCIAIRVNRIRYNIDSRNMSHQSEEYVDKLNVMYEVDNNDSLENLYLQLDKIILQVNMFPEREHSLSCLTDDEHHLR